MTLMPNFYDHRWELGSQNKKNPTLLIDFGADFRKDDKGNFGATNSSIPLRFNELSERICLVKEKLTEICVEEYHAKMRPLLKTGTLS